jgi:hypothetical protein
MYKHSNVSAFLSYMVKNPSYYFCRLCKKGMVLLNLNFSKKTKKIVILFYFIFLVTVPTTYTNAERKNFYARIKEPVENFFIKHL